METKIKKTTEKEKQHAMIMVAYQQTAPKIKRWWLDNDQEYDQKVQDNINEFSDKMRVIGRKFNILMSVSERKKKNFFGKAKQEFCDYLKSLNK